MYTLRCPSSLEVCMYTLRTESFINLSPLGISASRNVVIISDHSVANFIVGLWLFACSRNS